MATPLYNMVPSDETEQKIIKAINLAKQEGNMDNVMRGRQMLDQYRANKDKKMRTESASWMAPFTRGAGFGYGDEALAGVISSIAVLNGDIEKNKYGEMYQSVLDNLKAESEAYAEREGGLKSTAAEVAPSLGAGLLSTGKTFFKVPSLLKKLREGGLISAGTLAAIEGFIYGSGMETERLEEGDPLVPDLPLVPEGLIASAAGTEIPTYEGGIEDPYLKELAETFGARLKSGAEETPLSFILGAGGARATDALLGGFEDIATAKKWAREGQDMPERAPYRLEDPSQVRPTQVPEQAAPAPMMEEPSLGGIDDLVEPSPQMIDEMDPMMDQVPEAGMDVPEMDAGRGIDETVDPAVEQFDEMDPMLDMETDELFPTGRPEPVEGFAETAKELMPGQKPKLVKSQAAKQAAHQQLNPNIITNIENANAPTLNEMKELTRNFAVFKKSQGRPGTQLDPNFRIGTVLKNRMQKVVAGNKDAVAKQTAARKELAKITGEELKEIKDPILESFQSTLSNLRVGVEDNVLDFSQMQKSNPLYDDTATQRFLQNVWDDLLESKNAAELHDIRKNVDLQVNKWKTSNTSPDTQSQKIFKSLRNAIQNNLGRASTKYKEASDEIHETLKTLESVEEAFPQLKSKYNISDDADPYDLTAALNYIGSESRLIDSNSSRYPLMTRAIIKMDDLAKKYGGTSDGIDIPRLVRHHNLMRRQFGDRDQAIGGIMRGESEFMKKTREKAKKARNVVDSSYGINEKNQYKAIEDMIDEVLSSHQR